MPSYYLRTTGMSRGITDGTSKKNACTWHREYFRLSDEGLLSSVSEYEDGLLFYSAPAPLPVPQALPLPVLCPADLFHDAHARCVAYQRQKEAERKAAADFAKSLRDGLLFNAHAKEEVGAAELVMLADVTHWLDDFTVVDVETTGGSYAGADRLLEVAAVPYQQLAEVDRMQSFVQFSGEVPQHITQFTTIAAAHVRRAPAPKLVLQTFRRVTGDSVLVGHNVGFDLRLFEADRTRLGATAPLPNDFLCTLAVASHRYEGPHKLGELCARFGIPAAGAHRALNDGLMCEALLLRMHAERPIEPHLRNQTGAGKNPARRPHSSLFAA